MNVDASVFGIFYHVFGQYLSESHDNDQLGIDLCEQGGKFFIAQSFRLIYGQILLERPTLDDRGVITYPRPVGLSG